LECEPNLTHFRHPKEEPETNNGWEPLL